MNRILCLWLPDWADRQALESLARWCDQFSPLVALEQTPAPECLLLDITGLAPLFGSEAALVEKVLRALTARGLTVQAAVADTLGAAWAVAHCLGIRDWGLGIRGSKSAPVGGSFPSNPQSLIPNPFPAPVGGSFPSNPQSLIPNPFSGPVGGSFPSNPQSLIPNPFPIPNPFLVPPGETLAALRPLPVEVLRLPPKTVDLLHQLGVWRIEQLEVLPRAELSCRFGPQLFERWDQAVGLRSEPLPAYAPPPGFAASWSPENPTTRSETLQAALEYLLGRVSALLFQHGRGAMHVECRLDCTAGGPVQMAFGLFEPTVSTRHLFQLAQVQLEHVRLPGPVRTLCVRATSTAPLEPRQQELFPGDPHRHPAKLAGLIDRLSNRLGRRAVVRVRLVPDAQPEFASREEPLLDMAQGRREKGRLALPLRPLRLLPRPVRLEGPPLRFQFSRQTHEIAHRWGPERIETGWWRGRPAGRDYYRVETTAGCRFWLFRRLRDGRWFLHGLFE